MKARLRSYLAARLRRFSRSRSANIATLTALTMPLVLTLAAFAIDEGSLFLERRDLQAAADLAAIQAASDIANARTQAVAVLAANGAGSAALWTADAGDVSGAEAAPSSGLSVVTGIYSPDPSVDASARFAAASPPNAVRVTVRKTGTRFFATSLIPVPTLSATAVAATTREAAFSIGSRLARVDAGLLNALLGQLTGSTLSLTVMDYEALLASRISLLAFLDTLDTQIDAQAGTYKSLLDSRATVGDIAAALTRVGGLDLRAQAAVRRLARSLGQARQAILLAALADLGTYDKLPPRTRQPGLDPHVSPFDLLMAAAVLSAANGKRQAELALAADIPGLSSLSLALTIGEPMQQSPMFRIGPAGTTVRTAQLRLELLLEIGTGGALPLRTRWPIHVELAPAEAKIVGISCSAGGMPQSVTLEVLPGLTAANIGEARVLSGGAVAYDPARLATLPLLTVTGRASTRIEPPRPTLLRFDASDIARGTVKRVSTRGMIGSLSRSLLEDLRLQANVAGLSLVTPDAAKAAVAQTLAAAAPALDALIDDLLAALGVRLGEADVKVGAAGCGRPVLVQ